ncbi:hypothetical protein WJX74_008641 [Apatococcus lobatus]|uniref:FHA domain-containing protein n=1 Tax=Apatococcus lobatus TaxID=904363 RepID=A0AAW1RX51_9CHLO
MYQRLLPSSGMSGTDVSWKLHIPDGRNIETEVWKVGDLAESIATGRNSTRISGLDNKEARSRAHGVFIAIKLAEGHNVLAQMKTDFEQGMIVLMKNNTCGKYAPAADWVITGQNFGLLYLQFDALWHIVLAPTECILEDVHCLFFHQRASMAPGITKRAADLEWNITYHEAIEKAKQKRDALSQAAATIDRVRRDMTTELDSVLGDSDHYATGSAPEIRPAADPAQPRAPGQLAFDGLPSDGFMSVAEVEFVLPRLQQPFQLHGDEYARALVWCYRHCTQLERGLIMPVDAVLPMEVQLALSSDDRHFLGGIFSRSTFCQIFPLPFSNDEVWGDLDDADADADEDDAASDAEDDAGMEE